jgi:hypothetical protein
VTLQHDHRITLTLTLSRDVLERLDRVLDMVGGMTAGEVDAATKHANALADRLERTAAGPSKSPTP